jgi:hypothetical protein
MAIVYATPRNYSRAPPHWRRTALARVAGLRSYLQGRDACLQALVSKPARRLWPEKPVGSMLAMATRSLTMSETGSPHSRSEATRPCRSTGWKTEPASTRKWQATDRGQGQGNGKFGRRGCRPTLRPAPAWSVFDRPERDDKPLMDALDAIKRHDFRSPEPAREADREQRPIARALHTFVHCVRTRNRLSRNGVLASRRAIPRALARCNVADNFRPARIEERPRPVRLRHRRDAERLRMSSKVEATSAGWAGSWPPRRRNGRGRTGRPGGCRRRC